MDLVITGASGFLGRNVLRRAPADWRITALYNRDDAFPRFVSELGRRGVTAVRCDLANAADVAAFVRDRGVEWEACLYLAARVDIPWSVREPAADLMANTIPFLNFLEHVRVGKLVYFSSGAVYDGLQGEVEPTAPIAPTLPYAISKLDCERYAHFCQERRKTIDKLLIVRFFGAFGPYEAPHKIYTRLVHAFGIEACNRFVIYGNGANLIDAMFVDDAVDAIARMLACGSWNATVNLAGGHPLTIEALVEAVATAFGRQPVAIEKQGTANERNEFWGGVADMKKLFGFVPTISLADGVRRLREFLVGEHVAS